MLRGRIVGERSGDTLRTARQDLGVLMTGAA
jgi:hypothetical protein